MIIFQLCRHAPRRMSRIDRPAVVDHVDRGNRAFFQKPAEHQATVPQPDGEERVHVFLAFGSRELHLEIVAPIDLPRQPNPRSRSRVANKPIGSSRPDILQRIPCRIDDFEQVDPTRLCLRRAAKLLRRQNANRQGRQNECLHALPRFEQEKVSDVRLPSLLFLCSSQKRVPDFPTSPLLNGPLVRAKHYEAASGRP